MRAAILSIGDELVGGQSADSNAPWLCGQLASHAVTTAERRVVPDDRAVIGRAMRELADLYDVLLITGGLGPTPDDLTREALGDVLTPGEPLQHDAAAAEHLEQWFEGRGRKMPRSNLAQARRPTGTRFVPNPRGTAMGIAGHLGDCLIFAMPGPPHEMQLMFTSQVLPQIPLPPGGEALVTTTVHAYGLGESAAAERLGDILDRERRPLVGITVSGSVVTARIQAEGFPEQAERALRETASMIVRRWEPYAFGRDDESLSAAVGSLLTKTGQTLVTAESCTGGLLGKMIVDAPGSSAYYVGGWVTYSDALKTSCLGVRQELLTEHGAVSEPTACAMAEGALARSGADFGLAITGIAGPQGASAGKPVGTVYVGLGRKLRDSVDVVTRRFEFVGNRPAIRDRASKSALQMLRFAVLDIREKCPLLWEVPASARGRST